MRNYRRSNAAQKAASTRFARKQFVTKYGVIQAEVIRLLVGGWTPSEIVVSYRNDSIHLDVRSVRAFKANLTRGTYKPFVSTSGGSCNYDVY